MAIHSRVSTYAICRLSIAFIWCYHGIVPKLLGPHADELIMNMSLGLSAGQAVVLAKVAGLVEVFIGLSVLVFWRRRWPLYTTVFAMLALLVFVVLVTPAMLTGAFNPVSTNLGMIALAVVALRQLEAEDSNSK